MWDMILWIAIAIPVAFIVMGIHTAIADAKRTPPFDESTFWDN
jgi:hypothetical protein